MYHQTHDHCLLHLNLYYLYLQTTTSRDVSFPMYNGVDILKCFTFQVNRIDTLSLINHLSPEYHKISSLRLLNLPKRETIDGLFGCGFFISSAAQIKQKGISLNSIRLNVSYVAVEFYRGNEKQLNKPTTKKLSIQQRKQLRKFT